KVAVEEIEKSDLGFRVASEPGGNGESDFGQDASGTAGFIDAGESKAVLDENNLTPCFWLGPVAFEGRCGDFADGEGVRREFLGKIRSEVAEGDGIFLDHFFGRQPFPDRRPLPITGRIHGDAIEPVAEGRLAAEL